MTRKEAIEKMVAIKALVQITKDTYMLNLKDCQMDILPLGILVVSGGLIVSIAYRDMRDIHQCVTHMVIEMEHMETALRIPIGG